MSLRISAPFSFSFFRRGRSANERERQNVVDAAKALYEFYFLNMICVKTSLLPHPFLRGVRTPNWRGICFLNTEMESA